MASQNNLKRWQHLCNILQPKRMTSIIDIGANPIEPVPYEDLVREGFAQVSCFEPQESAYKALLDNPKANQTVLPYAIGTGEKGTLHVCQHSGFTSLLKPNADATTFLGRWQSATEVVQKVEVATKRLDDLTEIKHVDLVKIDIQGGELSVFENGLETLRNASAVITEVAAIPIYEKQPLLHDQMKFLHDQGFMLHKFMFFKQVSLVSRFSHFLFERETANQLVDGDAVFVRALLKLEQTADEDLKHLAVLSDAVFESYDLVVTILDILLKRGALRKEEQVLNYCKLLPNPRLRRLRQATSRLTVKSLAALPKKSEPAKISAIIICYNNKAYIDQAVRSAMSQRPQFEKIVIVDDCSTDGSYEVLLGLAAEDDRIDLHQNDVNSGPGAARNKGLNSIETPYFCFLDGDDYFSSTANETFEDAIRKHPDAELFIFGANGFEDGEPIRRSGGVANGIYNNLEDKKIALATTTFPWNKLYRTESIKARGVTFPSGRYEDLPWCYECILSAQKVVSIALPVVWYRIHKQSMLQQKTMPHFDVFKQWERTFQILKPFAHADEALVNFVKIECLVNLTDIIFHKRIPDEERRSFAEKTTAFLAPLSELEQHALSHPREDVALRRLHRLDHFLKRTKP